MKEPGRATLPVRGERGGIVFRLMSLLALALLIFVIYLVRRPLLREAGGFWVLEDPPSVADSLIILSDDDYSASRAGKAAELYKEHRAPVVVASGRMLRPYAGIGELMQRDLTERGVPAGAIVIAPHRAGDTLDEAQALRSLVVERKWRHVVIVTSNYHTRRARYIFRKVFPAGVQVDVSPADDPSYPLDGWWGKKEGWKIFLHETAGMIEAIWSLRHEPRDESRQSGAQRVREGLRGAIAQNGTTVPKLDFFIIYII